MKYLGIILLPFLYSLTNAQGISLGEENNYQAIFSSLYQDSSSLDIASEPHFDSIPNELNSVVYVELLGRAYLSLNYEIPITPTHLVSFGLGWNKMPERLPSGDQGTFSCPLVHAQYIYLLGKSSSFFEIGGGFTYVMVDPERLCNSTMATNYQLSLDAVVGYRHQITKDIIFRANFTPSSRMPDNCWPIFGFSLGYRL